MSAKQPLLQKEEYKLQRMDSTDDHKQQYSNIILTSNQPSINNATNTPLTITNNNINDKQLQKEYDEHNQTPNPFLLKRKTHIDIINGILMRDYGKIIFYMILFASIGFVLYLLTSIRDFVWFLGLIGLIIGIIVEQKHKKLHINHDKYIFKPIGRKETIKELDSLWTNDNIDANNTYKLYFKTDFYEFKHTKLKYVQCGSNRIYLKNNNPHTLIVEKRHFLNWRTYLGFETGAGIGIAGCILLYLFLFFYNVSVSFFTEFVHHPSFQNYMQPYIENISYLFNLNFMIICMSLTLFMAVIGALIESFLRKFNYLNHNETVQTVSYLIPLHIIRGIVFKTVDFEAAHNFETFTNIFIYVFKIYCWFLFVMFYGFPKLIFFFFTRNIAFFLWILVSVSAMFLFIVKIKHNSDYLGLCMMFILLATVVSIYSVWYLSGNKMKGCLCCNKCKPLQYDRINKKTQWCLFATFILVLICLIISSILITDVAMNIHHDTHKSPWKLSWNTWNKLICNNVTESVFNVSDIINQTDEISGNFDYIQTYIPVEDYSNYKDSEICSDDVMYSHLIVLVLLCLIWYILLFSSFIWYNNDKYKYKWKYPAAECFWKKFKYSYVYLYIKPEGFLAEALSNIYRFKYHRIELTTKQSYQLIDYLNQNVRYFKEEEFVIHKRAKHVTFYDDLDNDQSE